MSQIEALRGYQQKPADNALTQPVAGVAAKNAQTARADDKVKAKEIDISEINEAVNSINEALTAMQRGERQFYVDEDLGRLVVRIIRSDTKELIRQIPAEEALALSKRMRDMVSVMYG
jgi:flagellar protein FlaG